MPSTVGEDSLKRKRSQKASDKVHKRAKAESNDTDDDPQAEILLLENAILESKKNYNSITTLLELAQKDSDDDSTQLALVSLCRVFLRLLAAGNLARQEGQAEKDLVVIQWLRKTFGGYKQTIVDALGHENSASTALTLAMRILQAEGQYMTDKGESSFPKAFLKDIVDALVRCDDEDIRQEFCEKFLGEYADIRFYTFKALQYVIMAFPPN